MSNVESVVLAGAGSLTVGVVLACIGRYFKRSDDKSAVKDKRSAAQIEADDHSEARLYGRIHELEEANSRLLELLNDERTDKVALEGKLYRVTAQLELSEGRRVQIEIDYERVTGQLAEVQQQQDS